MTSLNYFERGPFSLLVEPKKIVAISGASGCGKTLMVRAIANMVDHHVEHLSLEGIERDSVSPAHWRRMLGIVQAHSFWWHDVVGTHFLADVSPLLKQVGLSKEILTQPCKNLSAGESQRLAVIRTLSYLPRMLILDEPTANLDVPTALKVEHLIQSYIEEHHIPVIWITHQNEQIKRVATEHFLLEKEGFRAVNH